MEGDPRRSWKELAVDFFAVAASIVSLAGTVVSILRTYSIVEDIWITDWIRLFQPMTVPMGVYTVYRTTQILLGGKR